MPVILLLDNTILSNFGLVRRSDILFELWGPLMFSTQAVIDEYQIGIFNRSLSIHAWDKLNIIELTPGELLLTEKFPGDLGDGERSCLAIAISRKGWIATDDMKARKAARNYGLSVTGTIGAFQEAIKQQIIELPEADILLRKMIQAGYHSPVTSLGKY
ncbi:MAG: hypothetical protein WCP19_08515 [Chloroflexota bacterium]